MQLLAREFECHPTKSAACEVVSPLVNQLGRVEFTGRIGEKNGGQLDSDLDDRLAEKFQTMKGVRPSTLDMSKVKKKFDFSLQYKNREIVVEVEKANWEKILYDFLKAHIYFDSDADFAVIFVPKNYVHSAKSPTKSFAKARQRYDHCVEYGFGSSEKLGRILLVGYEVALRDGRALTPGLRTQFIQEARMKARH